jgi:hypothetical protein
VELNTALNAPGRPNVRPLLDPAPRLAWLASLRAEFKAKRNFVAGLPVR